MKISIVTPNYNYDEFIGETIESVIKQNFDNYEHIIVDDGSTDNSVEIINKYIQLKDSKIILKEQVNQGQTPAINVGMRVAKGDIICWINSDDTFCPNVFSAVVNYFKNNPKCDVVFGDMNVTDITGNLIYRRRHLNFNYKIACLLGFTTVLSSNAVFWKREAMEKNGYFEESLKCNMDGDFFYRLTKGIVVKRINIPFANFRKQTHTKASEKNKNWDEIVKKEVEMERRNSYSELWISNIIPYKYSFIVRTPVHVYRVFLRFINLHFVLKKLEIYRYNKKAYKSAA